MVTLIYVFDMKLYNVYLLGHVGFANLVTLATSITAVVMHYFNVLFQGPVVFKDVSTLVTLFVNI